MKRSEVTALAAGLALVLAGVFVGMSLVTWDVCDPQVMPNYEDGPRVVRNRCGSGGALVSSFLFRAHGVAACAVPFALVSLGAYFIARRSTETGLRRAAGAAIVVMALSLLAGTRGNGWLASLAAERSIEGPGGAFGAVPGAVLTRFLGGVGTYLMILLALGSGSLLASRRAVERLLEATGHLVVSTGPVLVAFAARLRRERGGKAGTRAEVEKAPERAGWEKSDGRIRESARRSLLERILAVNEASERNEGNERDKSEEEKDPRAADAAPAERAAAPSLADGKDAEAEDSHVARRRKVKQKVKNKAKGRKIHPRPPAVAAETDPPPARHVRPGTVRLLPAAPALGSAGALSDPPAAGNARSSSPGIPPPATGKGESEAITRRMPPTLPTVDPTPKRTTPEGGAPGGYELPPAEILIEEEARSEVSSEELTDRGMRIVQTLAQFSIETKLVDVARGPAVTMYEFELAPGINVNRVTQLANNVAMAVAAQDVRIVAPIPGRGTIGIEVPNLKGETVRMRPVVECYRAQPDRLALPLMLGRSATGKPLVADLSKMPHLLVAGATGSGKSVCMDGIIMSMMMMRRPDEVRLVLVDPKVVELSRYRGMPHLACPVVTEMKRAAGVFDWAVAKMEERYRMFGAAGVRDCASFNKMPADEREGLARRKGVEDPEAFRRNMSYVVIVVDELADLMMVAAKEVETSIIRLAQKSRATGIHVVLATQRPSVDVLTGLIRANMPTRISFQVASRLESRIILDQNGAEKLLGRGDMLYMPAGLSSPVRAKGVYVTDEEIIAVLEHLHAQPVIREAEVIESKVGETGADVAAAPGPSAATDELYEQAVLVVLGTQRGSVSLLQRRLQIGYTRAGKLIDMMCADGLVGPQRGSKPREILVTLEEWEATRGGGALRKSA